MVVLTPPKFHNLNLDLVKMQAWAPQQIYATAGDTGYAQVFSLYMNGDPYTDASPETLNFRAIKPDNNVVDIKNGQGFQVMSGSSNKFVFTIPEQVFVATGRVECFFYITTTDGKMVASTTHFFYEVQRAMPSETGSISMIATLDDVVKQAHDLYAQAMSTMSEITATKTDTDKQATNFAVDLKQKQSDAEKQADQMLADVKVAMQKTAGDATDYQTKLDDLNKQYISKYNELLAKLPDADTAVKQKISDALAQIKDDEQTEFQKIEMDWVSKKQTLSDAITAYQNSVTKQLDDLKQQISGISSEKVTKLSDDIDALQQKLASLKLSDYYTKKEIDDKLDSFQPKIDLSGYETTAHAEDTYAKKTDIVAPNLSSYETTDHASETYETKEDAANHLTKTQADASYASKSDIPDVSGFETKTDADATYAKKADIPALPDLSGYETVTHADETFAKKSDIVSPNLTDYAKSADVAKTYETKEDAQTHLTKTQADADYATKADLANVKPDMSGYVKDSDLADYARKSDVSPIKSIHVLPNGWPSDQPGNKLEPDQNGNVKIDLSQYVYESEFRSALPNMSYYLSKSDAEADYAKKSDIPNLSAYLTKTDADSGYLAKSDAANFATKDDLKKIGMPDLSAYLTKTDADSNYIKSFKVYYRDQGHTTFQSVTTDNTNLMLMNFLTKTDADANYVSNTNLDNKKYIQMIDFTKDGAGYNAGTVETVNYSSGTTSNVMHIDLAKLSNLITPDISTNAYNKSQTYYDSKSLSSTYANGQDLSNLAYPCVVHIDMTPGNFDETNDPKEFSKVNANVIVRRYDNYYLGGHKLAFAD